MYKTVNKVLIIVATILVMVFVVLAVKLFLVNPYGDYHEPMPKVDVTDEQKEMKEAFDVKELWYRNDDVSIYRHETESHECIDVITESKYTTLCEPK